MFVLTNSPKEFIPSTQQDKENPLTFIIIPPSRKLVLETQAKMLENLSADGDVNILNLPLTELMDIYFNECVVGWKNVRNDKGEEIEFTKENFALFNNLEILNELYMAIKELAESDPLV